MNDDPIAKRLVECGLPSQYKERLVPISDNLLSKWNSMRHAINMAAAPFTDMQYFALEPSRAYELLGMENEVDAVLKNVKADSVNHMFCIGKNGVLTHKLYWKEK